MFMFNPLHFSKSFFGLFSIFLIFGSSIASADEVEQAIQEGLEKYKAAEYSGAGQSLQYAINLLNEKKGNQLLGLLPGDVDGWTASEGEMQSLGILGGGITATRDYTKDELAAKITVTVDSPLVQQMLGMLSNPLFAGQLGMKMRKIDGQDALYNPQSGEVSIVLDNRILLKVEGNQVPEADLMALAGHVKLAELKAMK